MLPPSPRASWSPRRGQIRYRPIPVVALALGSLHCTLNPRGKTACESQADCSDDTYCDGSQCVPLTTGSTSRAVVELTLHQAFCDIAEQCCTDSLPLCAQVPVSLDVSLVDFAEVEACLSAIRGLQCDDRIAAAAGRGYLLNDEAMSDCAAWFATHGGIREAESDGSFEQHCDP